MLSVIRELAEEAEARAADGAAVGDLLRRARAPRRGRASRARRSSSQVLRDAGVVDAGGAGLLELVRGVAAARDAASRLPERAAGRRADLGFEAIHQELSRYRYCTVFVDRGRAARPRRARGRSSSSSATRCSSSATSALKVHVHTDDPGAALSLGTAVGTIDADRDREHARADRSSARSACSRPCPTAAERAATDVVAVVAGDGNRRLFESLAGSRPDPIVEGGQTMNPSTADLLAAVAGARRATR